MEKTGQSNDDVQRAERERLSEEGQSVTRVPKHNQNMDRDAEQVSAPMHGALNLKDV